VTEDILKRLQACAIAGCSPQERALALEAAKEIALLREERLIVKLPMPFEPWRHGPLSYRKCEVIAALKKAGVKWQPLPPGLEGE